MSITQNILLIDKPKGITSFDVIRALRRKLGVRKMGHAGTLDPLATGLMLVGVGESTKELAALIGLPKTYEAEVLLGLKTDTGDLEGATMEEAVVPEVNEEEVRKVLAGMVGVVPLPVPKYSAVKRGGEALYKKARRGEQVEVPVKEMKIHSCELKKHAPLRDKYVLGIVCEVGSGAYIRSIAEEIGRRLGVPATIKELRRTKIGKYRVEDAEKI
ncbi:MAG: tRNA pseudouridine(55) synthase TruB [Patescibacteria group bacterium]|nr:tRNA pseudouridine(55) synthase TruB [Patescibacteria group bacterium]